MFKWRLNSQEIVYDAKSPYVLVKDTDLRVKVYDGNTYLATASGREYQGLVWVTWQGYIHCLKPVAHVSQRAAAAAATSVKSPMTGTIKEVRVKPAQEVEAMQVLVIIEAMKMQIPLHADVSAKIAVVRCVPGDFVQEGQILIELEKVS